MKETKHIILFLLFATGCSPSTEHSQIEQNRKNLERIQVGMSKREVLSIMGEKRVPVISSTDKTLEIFYYPTEKKSETNAAYNRKSGWTPVVFDKGNLAGWGWDYLDSNIDKYKHRFLEDLQE